MKNDLDQAGLSYNCGDMRTTALEVAPMVGKKACIHG